MKCQLHWRDIIQPHRPADREVDRHSCRQVAIHMEADAAAGKIQRISPAAIDYTRRRRTSFSALRADVIAAAAAPFRLAVSTGSLFTVSKFNSISDTHILKSPLSEALHGRNSPPGT